MAIANKYPTIRPSLNLDFANSKTIDPRITFSRASSATYFDEKGAMRTAPAGVPRIDHDPVTGECKGLLIEEQRTNLLTYSEDFTNAAWTKGGVTLDTYNSIAPNGIIGGYRLIESATTLRHFVYEVVTLAAGTTYTFQVTAKKIDRRYLQLALYGAAFSTVYPNLAAIYDFDTQAFVTTGANATTTQQPLSNGWVKLSITVTADVGGSATATVDIRNGANITTGATGYIGDGTSSVAIFSTQLEVGAFPTSYIKTEASQVTRAADNAVMTGANFSDWTNLVGTVLAKYKTAGWKHNNTPPVTQLDLTKAVDDYSTSMLGDNLQRLMFYPRQLTADQITALKG